MEANSRVSPGSTGNKDIAILKEEVQERDGSIPTRDGGGRGPASSGWDMAIAEDFKRMEMEKLVVEEGLAKKAAERQMLSGFAESGKK